MRLEKVEIFGFKSFPQKVSLHFDRGMTAFVGPNGCGKTNIVEAVRWALGEQNAHLLRCDKMEDVIFNGTKSRKSLGVADVTLTLLNDGDIPLEFSEVAVSRRLYRSGESEYLINKRPCRLREILDLFLDTGLGHGAYSFFEQKMIDRILSSEPAARRSFFEEAAGIAKYRSRKTESLRRLEATEADLLRLEDIIGEIEKSVRALRRQARRAERYLSLKDELREADIALAKARVENLAREAAGLRERVSSQQEERAEKTAALTSLEERLSGDRSWLSEEEEDSRRRGEELEDLSSKLQRLSEEILVSREKRRFLKDGEKRLKAELHDLSSRLPEMEDALEGTRMEAQAAEKSVGERRKGIEVSMESLREMEEDVVEKRLSLEEKEESLREQVKRTEDLERDLISLRARTEATRERSLALGEELVEFGSRQEELKGRLTELREELAGLTDSLRREEAQGKALGDELGRRKKRFDELSQELTLLERGLHRRRSELEILSSHQERLEGYTSAAKYLIEREGVKVIDDLIDFPPEYQKAVEGVLSFKSQAAVVASSEDALRLLSVVGEKGQVTLLPLDLIKSGDDPELPSNPRVLGVLRDFITCEKEFGPILEALLGGYILVEDLRTALHLSKEERFRGWGLVTPQGEVVEPARAVTGGESRGGVLGRKRRLRDMEKEISSAVKEVETKRREAEGEAEEISRLTSRIEEFKELVGGRVEEKVAMELRLNRHEYEEEGLVSTLNQLKKERALAKKSLDVDEGELERKDAHRISSEDGMRRMEAELKEERDSLSRSEETLDKISREIDLSQIDLLREEERLKSLRREIERGENRIEELRSLRKRKEGEILQIGKGIESLKENLEQKEREQKGLSQGKERLLKEKAKSEERRKKVYQRVGELEGEVGRLRRELGSSEGLAQKLRMNLLKLEMEEGSLRESVSKEYDIDLEAVPEKDIAIEEAQDSIEKLKESVRRLEPVNPLASQELKEAEERLDFLRSQGFDLVEGKETLRNTLSSVERKARLQFVQTFEEIRRNFKEIFSRLFGEGEADLFLSREAAPLEAEIGVVARPPGKRLQRIELLSAGERSLLAIALLFAIYLTRPSPFCILDELDAALDDANLERFISLLKELSQNSQLVLVTHNRRTMEVADYLYGVTMAEPGVTSIVSVKMDRNHQMR